MLYKIRITDPSALSLNDSRDLLNLEVEARLMPPYGAVGWGSYFTSRRVNFSKAKFLISGKGAINALKKSKRGSTLLGFLGFLDSSGACHDFILSSDEISIL
jgi:hypothetical protein